MGKICVKEAPPTSPTLLFMHSYFDDALRQKYFDTKFPSIVCLMFYCDIFFTFCIVCFMHLGKPSNTTLQIFSVKGALPPSSP